MAQIQMLVSVLLYFVAGCAIPQEQSNVEHVFYSPAMGQSKGWIAILPGQSGSKIFGDDCHYHGVAREFNKNGFDTICVDYKPFYRSFRHSQRRSTGEKISWTLQKAIESLTLDETISPTQPGFIACWSLGGEGGWEIVNDKTLCSKLNVRGAVLWYPSNLSSTKLRNCVPIQIHSGSDDDVVNIADLKTLSEGRAAGSSDATLFEYANAHHGFDVSALKQKRVVRLVPFVEPKATFEFDESSARQAMSRSRFVFQKVGGRSKITQRPKGEVTRLNRPRTATSVNRMASHQYWEAFLLAVLWCFTWLLLNLVSLDFVHESFRLSTQKL